MSEFLNSFNNREISLAIWIAVALLWALSKSEIRHSSRDLLAATTKVKILAPSGIMAIYVWGIAAVLARVGLWNSGLLKDTLLWFIGTALILFGKSVSAASDPQFFRKTLIGCIKVTVVLQFLSNTYVFPLWVELLLIPAVTVIGIMGEVVKTEERLAIVAKLFGTVFNVVALVVFLFTLQAAWDHRADFTKGSTYLTLALPSLLTVGLMPFIFAMCLWSEYESQFIRLSFWLKDKPKLIRVAHREAILSCGLNPYKLRRLVGWFYTELQDASTAADVRRVVRLHASGKGRALPDNNCAEEEEA